MENRWNVSDRKEERGVVIGCDNNQEWLLKWWWNHYRKSNSLPVTLFDFGMSASARKWCKSHFDVIPFPPPSVSCVDSLFPASWSREWKEKAKKERSMWFAKALSLLRTPYLETIRLDLDCACLKNIEGAFSFSKSPGQIALALDEEKRIEEWKMLGFLRPRAKGYQAGVIVYTFGSVVIEQWAQYIFSSHASEYSDQTALNHVIADFDFDVSLLPSSYNWLYPERGVGEAVIVHYGGEERKIWLIRESCW